MRKSKIAKVCEIKAWGRLPVSSRPRPKIQIPKKAESVPRIEAQAHRIDAVPLPCGLFGAIVEDMAQVAATIGTEGLGAQHSVGGVPDIFNGPFHGLIEGRPAAIALELVPTLKEQGVAGLAVVIPLFEMKVVFSGMWPFRALLSQYEILLGRQNIRSC